VYEFAEQMQSKRDEFDERSKELDSTTIVCMNLQSRCKVKEMEFDERWSLPKMASRISDTVELIRYKQYIYISLLLSIKNCIYRLPQKTL